MPKITVPLRAPGWAGDAVLGTAVLVTALLTTLGPTTSEYRTPDRFSVVLVLLAALPYYLRRRTPLLVLVVTSTAVVVLLARRYDAGALPLVLLLGAYTLGAWRPWREILAGIAWMEAALLLLLVSPAPGFGVGDLVASGVAYPAAMAMGWSVQSGRRRIAGFGEEQAASERRAAADERLRIAQELHDVVAHSLGVIAVQAGVGAHVINTDPAAAKESLEHISRMSRSSLTEIRWLLGRVRDEDGAASYVPAPGLGDLSRLCGEVGDAGLPVTLSVDQVDVDGVPPGVGLAAYRIVQEALTNALRHSGAGQASVRVIGASGVLRLEVADDGRGRGANPGGGHGLVGMRERAAVYGGTVDVGPGPAGGFRVQASLPFGEEGS